MTSIPEMKRILNHVVTIDNVSPKFEGLLFKMIECINEQQSKIENLQEQISYLQKRAGRIEY